MPDSPFVNEIQNRMIDAVECGDIRLARSICDERLTVELGATEVRSHSDATIKHWKSQ